MEWGAGFAREILAAAASCFRDRTLAMRQGEAAQAPASGVAMTRDRRSFFKTSASAISAAGLTGCGTDASEHPASTDVRRLDRVRLRAVGDAVLPESLGEDGRERAVVAFEIWLQELEPEAELVHPYGGWIVPYAPGDPSARWAEQLEALEQGAQDGSITLQDRRAMLAERIEDEGPGFPSPAYAHHVAVALMAHYFGSSDATNACYGVAIDKLRCRVIATAGEKPPSLELESRA